MRSGDLKTIKEDTTQNVHNYADPAQDAPRKKLSFLLPGIRKKKTQFLSRYVQLKFFSFMCAKPMRSDLPCHSVPYFTISQVQGRTLYRRRLVPFAIAASVVLLNASVGPKPHGIRAGRQCPPSPVCAAGASRDAPVPIIMDRATGALCRRGAARVPASSNGCRANDPEARVNQGDV